VYAKNKEDFEENAAAILGMENDFPKFTKRFKEYMNRQREWAIYARADICLRGHQTNNYAEVSMKILKEVVLERMRAYNPVALIEFIIGPLDSYYKRRLLDHAHNRHSAHSILLDKLLGRIDQVQPEKVVKVDETCFMVPSAAENGNFFLI
jgi:hypothetical protein